jgi:hypothetical protein
MRRSPLKGLWLALLFALCVPLLAAVNAFPPPVVVVYPLTVTGNANPQTGSNLAILFSTKLAQLGGITVKPYVPGTQRPQYLDAARSVGADYYVAGYVAPLGDVVSIVTQVVSTRSATVVYSSTTLAATYVDAAAQVETLHDAIVHHAGRALASLEAAPPSAAPTPLGDKGVDVGKILHRRAKPSPAASAASPAALGPSVASPAASPATLQRAASGAFSALVVDVTGDRDQSSRTAAADALVAALHQAGVSAARVAIEASDAVLHAGDLCRANGGARAIYASTLTVARSPAGAPRSVQLDVVDYDCNATALGRTHVEAPVRKKLDDAIDAAAAHAIGALLGTTPKTSLRAAPPATT